MIGLGDRARASRAWVRAAGPRASYTAGAWAVRGRARARTGTT